MKNICIIGAGSIGGFIGTRLAATGQTAVSAIARGATLDALRTHGWRLRQGIGQDFIATAEVTRLGGRVGSTQMRLHNDAGVLIATGAAAYIVS